MSINKKITSICGIKGEWERGITKNLWVSVTIFCTIIIFKLIFGDLLGLSKVSLWSSTTLFYQWMAPEYPFFDDSQSGVSQDISVVVLTDTDLQEYNESWPASYDFHAVVISAILKRQPKAILVDIGFIEKRDGLDELVEVLRQAKDPTKVDVFLASPACRENPTIDIVNEIKDLENAQKHITFVSVIIDPTRIGNRYRLTDNRDNCDKPSAALAMYNSGIENCNKGGCITSNSEYMQVGWGEFRKDMDKNNSVYECDADLLGLPWWRRIGWTIRNNIPPTEGVFEQGFNNKLRQKCPPHQAITVGYLLQGNDQCWLNAHIKNHFVLYGIDIEMVDDSVEPPTNFNLPGVFFHAMALDNLLRFKDNFIKDNLSSYYARVSSIAMLALVIIITLLTRLEFWFIDGAYRNCVEEGANGIKRLLFALIVDLVLALIALGIIGLAVCYLFYSKRIAPIDFVGLLSLISIGVFTRLYSQAINCVKLKFRKD